MMFDTVPQLDCAGRILRLDRPQVMGIVNVTPDSFSDGGAHDTTDAAVAHALRLVEEGADVLDIGGESTRPGAAEVEVEEELVAVPVIERLAAQVAVPISIDTSKPEVMRAAAGRRRDDQRQLRPAPRRCARCRRRAGVPVVLMHMQGEPRSMQAVPQYDDVVGEVHRFLAERIFAAEMAGIPKQRIVVDPGFGFGKDTAHNLQLLAQFERFVELRRYWRGCSRKRSIGELDRSRRAGGPRGRIRRRTRIAAQRGAAIVRGARRGRHSDALKVERRRRRAGPSQ